MKRSNAAAVVNPNFPHLSPEDRKLAPAWLPADWACYVPSAYMCDRGHVYSHTTRRPGRTTVPDTCPVDGAALVHWKRCATCRVWKVRDDFYSKRAGAPAASAQCRPCHSAAVAADQRAVTAAARGYDAIPDGDLACPAEYETTSGVYKLSATPGLCAGCGCWKREHVATRRAS